MSELAGKSVLIVEDETIVAMVLEDMLLDLGADEARSAANVEDALSLIEECRFDLGILDINLGNERSEEVAEALRARNIPIIFATGYNDGADSTAIILQKPYTQADVEAALKKVMIA